MRERIGMNRRRWAERFALVFCLAVLFSGATVPMLIHSKGLARSFWAAPRPEHAPDAILEWNGANRTLLLAEDHPSAQDLLYGEPGFEWIETVELATRAEMLQRVPPDCEDAGYGTLMGYQTYWTNLYHFMQDCALPVFIAHPEAAAVRVFAAADFPRPTGFELARHWMPLGVEAFPLRDRDPSDAQCLFLRSAHVLGPRNRQRLFTDAGSPVDPRSPVRNVPAFARMLAGGHFRLAGAPRPIRFDRMPPVVVRVLQRRGQHADRNFDNVDVVLAEARRLFEESEHGTVVADVGVLFAEDFQDDKRALLRAMQSIDVLIGFHGAGMTNMMFMRPCSSVTQVVLPVHCFWYKAMIFEGLARSAGLVYSQFCVHPENTRMRGGEEKTEEFARAVRQDREEGQLPDQHAYLYRVEGVRVSPVEMAQMIRMGVRNNLSCRTAGGVNREN